MTSAGIGKQYTENKHKTSKNKFKDDKTDETYKTRQRAKMNLPIYYRNKIYSEEEREKLWTNKLDKNERYVDGKKVDVSKGMDEYYMALQVARNKNARLGYDNDEQNWSRKEYERQYRDWETDRKSTRLNSSHRSLSRMPSSA